LLVVFFSTAEIEIVKALRAMKANLQIVSPDANLLEVAPHNIGFIFTRVSQDKLVCKQNMLMFSYM